jgi:ankyrin repeat protein
MTRRLITGCMAVLLASAVGMINLTAAEKSAVADAVARGDKAALQSLLAQKADVNGTQVDGTTALHWAVYKNDVATVDQLIKAGAKVAVANRQNTTPLLMAATYGNPEMVSRLLKAGADAKALGPNNETTLMLAARSGNPATIKILLAAGVPVNAKEPLRGTTALMWAVEQSHPEAVKALLDGGADFSVRANGAGTGRAYMSPSVGAGGINAAKNRLTVLKETGKSIEDQIKEAATAGGGRGGNNNQGGQGGNNQGGRGGRGGNNAQAGNAAGGGNQPAAAAGAAGGQQAAAGGNNAGGGRGGRGQGGGQQAAAGGNNAGRGNRGGQGGAAQTAAATDGAEDEEEEDAAPQAGLQGQGGGGLTALSFAARQGDLQSVKYLLAAGANINQTTSGGWTPLLTATNNRNYKLGKYLVEQGADVNIVNGQNFSPLYLATDNRNIEGGDFPVPKADMDHLEYIKVLLDAGAKVDHRVTTNTETRTIFTNHWFFEPGTTPFVRAAQSGDLALMKLLLSYGADPKAKNDYGDTALSAVAGIGWVEGVTYEHSPQQSVEVVKMLLDLGLDPNSTNRDLRTPLMGAAHKGRNEIIQLLVDRGAKLDLRDKGSRDTDKGGAVIAGHSWIALDYADGLVRVGVQSANPHPESAKLIRKLMSDRGMFVPPENRDMNSICIVDICQERKPEFLNQ